MRMITSINYPFHHVSWEYNQNCGLSRFYQRKESINFCVFEKNLPLLGWHFTQRSIQFNTLMDATQGLHLNKFKGSIKPVIFWEGLSIPTIFGLIQSIFDILVPYFPKLRWFNSVKEVWNPLIQNASGAPVKESLVPISKVFLAQLCL